MTARLTQGEKFVALTPIGFEYDDPNQALVGVGNEHWMRVKVEANDGTKTWERIDPCFTDAELHGLVRWFRGLASGYTGTSNFEGLEPNLQFQAQWLYEQIQLQAFFNLRLHPDGRNYYEGKTAHKLFFELTRAQARSFADDLAADLAAIPDPTTDKP